MNDELKKQHLKGLHKKREEELRDSCIFCENYLSAKKRGLLSGETLNVIVNDDIPLSDIFG